MSGGPASGCLEVYYSGIVVCTLQCLRICLSLTLPIPIAACALDFRLIAVWILPCPTLPCSSLPGLLLPIHSSPGDFSRAAISSLVNLRYQRNLDETPRLMVSKGSRKPGIEPVLWSCASPCKVRSEWNGFLRPCWHLPGFLKYT